MLPIFPFAGATDKCNDAPEGELSNWLLSGAKFDKSTAGARVHLRGGDRQAGKYPFAGGLALRGAHDVGFLAYLMQCV